MIVVDASALVVALVAAPGPRTSVVTAALAEAVEVHAPEVVVLDAVNALRGVLRGGHITQAEADAAVVALGAARLHLHGHAELAPDVWTLRDRLSACDAAYLVVADRVRARTLVTADTGLAAVARDRLGASRVTLV